MATLIGRQLGQYQVLAELGRGQHSVVYKAWQPTLERYVALKVLQQHDEATRARLQAEALLIADLIQRGAVNIRQIYEVGQTGDGYIFVALEYVEDSLDNLLRRVSERGGVINAPAAARLLAPLANALDTIHRLGYTHLDLKPQNILISDMGRTVLADLGIAQRHGTTTHACTPVYASPEQADGQRRIGPWSDIYALGTVLYQMVTGRPPFSAEVDLVLLNKHLTAKPVPPRTYNHALTRIQQRAILSALSKSPADRPRTASELLARLSGPDRPAAGAAATPRGLGTGPARRSRLVGLGLLLALLVAAILLMAAILLAAGLWGRSEPGEAPPTTVAPVPTALSTPNTPLPAATRLPTGTARPTSTLAPTPTRTHAPGSTGAPAARLAGPGDP